MNIPKCRFCQEEMQWEIDDGRYTYYYCNCEEARTKQRLEYEIKELEKSLNDKKEELKSHIDNSVVNVVLKSLKYEIDRIEREYYYSKETD